MWRLTITPKRSRRLTSTTRPITTPRPNSTHVEYSADLEPDDTTIESTYVFFIKRGGELQVEVGSHTTGRFPIATWGRLLAEPRFEVERVDYPVSKDGRPMFLWVGQDDSW